MLNQLEKYSRVKCGYAALSDVKTKQHEDRVDSFFYAETFKYLYLIFAEEDDANSSLAIDVNDFLFTTEAHLIPLNMDPYKKKKGIKKSNSRSYGDQINNKKLKKQKYNISEYEVKSTWISKSCPSLKVLFGTAIYDKAEKHFNITEETQKIRESVSRTSNEEKCAHHQEATNVNFNSPSNLEKLKSMPLRAIDFVAGRKDHIDILNKMGVQVTTMSDGRIQLIHKSNEALTLQQAEMGILFMTEMLELSKQQNLKSNVLVDEYRSISIVLLSSPFAGLTSYPAGPAQFGYDFRKNYGMFGKLILANPFDGCSDYNFTQSIEFSNKIVVTKRGNCMFIEKARKAESYGAVGLIIIDNIDDSSYYTSPLFAMSGDGNQNVQLPSLFLFGKEGKYFLDNFEKYNDMIVYIGDSSSQKNQMNGVEKAIHFNTEQLKHTISIDNKNSNNRKCSNDRSVFKKIFKKKHKCFLKDYTELKYYFDLYTTKNNYNENEKEEENFLSDDYESADQVKTINLDESIKIKLLKNKTKILVINIEFIKTLISSPDNVPSDDATLANDIYSMLISRLEQKTNFERLENQEVYKSAISNYVNFSINHSSLSDNDQLLLEQLAYLLDFKN
jgi:mannosidase alpha-like ER degradation enhancer 3